MAYIYIYFDSFGDCNVTAEGETRQECMHILTEHLVQFCVARVSLRRVQAC
jgi:hypothetical protein